MDKKSSADTAHIAVQIAPEFSSLLSEETVRRAAQAALRNEGHSGQVTIVITDDDNIRELNRDFLGKDSTTDVLAFAAQETADPFVAAPEADEYLGDVIISYPRALAQAKQFGHSPKEEVHLLVVHGILHLLGYDHATEDEKLLMWSRQDTVLRQLRSP
jgi:probable rRNA maturation factor